MVEDYYYRHRLVQLHGLISMRFFVHNAIRLWQPPRARNVENYFGKREADAQKATDCEESFQLGRSMLSTSEIRNKI